MAIQLLTKIFGSRNDRLLKQYRRDVTAIHSLETAMEALSDEQLLPLLPALNDCPAFMLPVGKKLKFAYARHSTSVFDVPAYTTVSPVPTV